MGGKRKETANTAKIDWRSWFSPATLKQAEHDIETGRLIEFSHDETETWASGKTAGGFSVKVVNAPTNYSECRNVIPWNMRRRRTSRRSYWDDEITSADEYEGGAGMRHVCTCSANYTGQLCRHLASLMIRWEEVRGPFEFTETQEEIEERLKREEEIRERRRKEEEEARRRELERLERELLRKERFHALDYLRPKEPEVPSDTMFNHETILQEVITDRYQTNAYERCMADGKKTESKIDIGYDREGRQVLEIRGNSDDYTVFMSLNEKSISVLNCQCGRARVANPYSWNEYAGVTFMCSHALAVYDAAWKRIVLENPGDATDKNASTLLTMLAGKTVEVPEEYDAPVKEADVELVPRIVSDKDNVLRLAFNIGLKGGRSLRVRGIDNLYEAVKNEVVYELSKKVSIDFSAHTFTPECEKWFDFITVRMRDVDMINRKISDRMYYPGYYNNSYVKVGQAVALEGSELDAIYDLCAGSTIAYQKNAGQELTVSVGKGRLRMEITVDPVYGRGRSLKAVKLEGTIPVTLQGNKYRYILDDRHFGRIDAEDMDKLAPYRSAAGGGDTFSCIIGRKKFAEFFYRVLPEMLNADYIKVTDNIGNKAAAMLPPEPDFTFYLDAGDGIVTCKAYAQYGDDKYNIIENAGPLDRLARDADQEERVKAAVGRYFPEVTVDRAEAFAPDDGEYLLRILTEGVPALSQFGQVNGSDAFYRVRVRKAPQPKVQVSLESGILDLTIQTKDMSPDELIELLASYRLKKRWHRLKSGDFVDLRDTERLRELDELAEGMDLSLDELVMKGAKLPAYRALYLDRMLEDHEEIAASRDKHFKSLIRSYNTIRDSDFEVSGELADTLRPYQVYGFRWLSTLSQSGFGGILADEMGLGKTVQMLALLKSEFDAGETRPSLVVCPASLVYNWKEECRRFTPGMPAVTLAGTLGQRKKQIANAFSENAGTLMITSYDLLKRDITLYKDMAFSSVILDEAQYIKNPKAAVTKSVKTLKAEHRYALTGTPIENRLSELWSIFDFLMPGFLYTASEYTARFETPIMKGKDGDAAARLSKMTEPFILRRKKMEVLKDLPDKLEEIQSTEMEGEQRKLYDAQVAKMKALISSSGDTGEEKMRILAEITRLRQICCDPSLVFDGYKGESAKRAACIELVQSAIDGGHRILLFSQFTSMMALLEKDLKKEEIPYFVITGATSKQERLRLVNEFNSGDTPLFLISLKAGGTGLNLTGADVVIHYDPWWNLAVQNQATDRAHRIGQTRQVTVMKLIAADSIEERIVELQEAKRDLADAIIGNQTNSLMSLSREELMELLG